VSVLGCLLNSKPRLTIPMEAPSDGGVGKTGKVTGRCWKILLPNGGENLSKVGKAGPGHLTSFRTVWGVLGERLSNFLGGSQ
jgi:hypothetical protein